jgi:hypothetical protein
MTRKVTAFFAAAVLTIGVVSASTGFAQGSTPGTPVAPPGPAPVGPAPQGQGKMGGHGQMDGNGMASGGMMDTMGAMTRMANNCNAMMERAAHAPATPHKASPSPSHG